MELPAYFYQQLNLLFCAFLFFFVTKFTILYWFKITEVTNR